VSRAAVARNLAAAVALALVPFLPAADSSAEAWLAAGLVLALAGLAALALLVLALAREVGELRLAIGPQLALEIPGEGPPLDAHVELIDRFAITAETHFALAVFSSPSCPLCRAIAPAVALLGRDPRLALELLDEREDAAEWRRLSIPGSPYAIVLARDGRVCAQGTFNSLGQLEGLVATAERRQRGGAPAHA
jgi:hypothetical protein